MTIHSTSPLTSVPVSVKLALTIGAVTGATVALIANRDHVLEAAESMFENGARFCRTQLEKSRKNKMFADAHEDSYFANQNIEYVEASDSSDDDLNTDTDFATTPEASDFYPSDDEEDNVDRAEMRRRRMSDEVKEYYADVD